MGCGSSAAGGVNLSDPTDFIKSTLESNQLLTPLLEELSQEDMKLFVASYKTINLRTGEELVSVGEFLLGTCFF